MRHRLEKGIVSVALGVSMAFSMCPATVIAEEYADQTANEQEEASQETDQPDSQPGDTEDTKDTNDTEEESSTDTQTHDGITFEAWTATGSLPTTAGNYYLANDVTLSDRWEAPMGESRLDLNGKSIKRDAGEESVAIEVPTAAFLDLYDYAGSGAIQPSEGAFVAHGVDVYDIGAFRMHAGTIKGFGLGVHVSQAVFEMSGGLITANGSRSDAESIGGGVYFTSDGDSTFDLSGGEISNNEVGSGAGAYVPGNVAVRLSGAPKVTGNTSGDAARNVYFAKSDSDVAGLAVTGTFEEGASLGVAKDMEGGDETAPVFTDGFKLANPDADPAAYFTSDDDAYVIAQTLLGEGYFVRGYNVKLAEGIEHGTVTLSKTKAVEGDTVTITATAEEGYALATLTATDAEGKAVTITENAFVMPASEVTVNATFEAENMLTVTFDPNGGEGSMAPAKVVAGKDTKLPTSTFTRSGYIFASWNTKPDGTGTRISNGATVKVTSDVTLYAQWAKSATASTGTASSTTAGSTATTLAKTTDPTSVAAVAAMVAAGAGAAFVGTRKNRKQ